MYKWFLESRPQRGSGWILFSRSFNTFQFFTDEERATHNLKDVMRSVKSDAYAAAVLHDTMQTAPTS